MTCDYCKRQFKTVQGLASHERAFHGLENACPICEGGVGLACSWHFA